MAKTLEDKRLEEVKTNQEAALQAVNDTYGGQTEKVGQVYENLQTATQEWTNNQAQLQQEQTDLALEQLQQQQDQAKESYEKEQAAAYGDYQKQTARHGVNAEQLAAMGMAGTGFSESSRVAQYTAYQNRVATAKASFDQAVLNYQNGMKEAQLLNSSALAQITFQGLQTQLTLALEGLQYENQMAAEMLGMKLDVQNIGHSQYMDVLNQINQEKSFAESVRQYEQQFGYQQEQDAQSQANWQAEFDRLQDLDKQEQENWDKSFQEEQRQFNEANDIEYATDDELISMAKEKYPNGVVTDKEEWDLLVAVLGEEALKKAGITYQNAGSTGNDTVKTPKNNSQTVQTLR